MEQYFTQLLSREKSFEVSQLQPENVPYTTWMMRLRSFYCIAFENMITWLLAVTNMPTISSSRAKIVFHRSQQVYHPVPQNFPIT